VLRKILKPKRDEVMEGWRKMHNEKFHDFSCALSVIRLSVVSHVACMKA